MIFLGVGCHSSKEVTPRAPEKTVDRDQFVPWNPETPYNISEFRAAWVATVANINWPSKPGLPVEDQQDEAIKLLDRLKNHHFNAVILQVRPQADALYESVYEPWSYYLTGTQGEPPKPYYDPLAFWIRAAHERGLELHAWLNPYRAHHTTGGEISEQSIIKTHPELVVKLENGMYWMDPSLKGTQERSLAVVMDIVRRYDIDGIHFDDYFYPYDSYNKGKDFPDTRSWESYRNSEGGMSRGDWRRDHVNRFIKQVYTEIKAIKPYVKFGISPFGIWRPGYPESIQGYDQYERLYADARLWLQEGWVDYFAPQLYWKISALGQSFPVLLGWWENQNRKQRHLWPGIRLQSRKEGLTTDETVNQIMITRGMLPTSKGSIHWSIGPLVEQDTLADRLIKGPYRKNALVPPSPWLDNVPPQKPLVDIRSVNGSQIISWDHPEDKDVFRWVLYYQYRDKPWEHLIISRSARTYELQHSDNDNSPLQNIGLTAVDRTGNQSAFFKVAVAGN